MKLKRISYYIEKSMINEQRQETNSTETQAEILYNEIGQILKPYGNIKNGFSKKFDKNDIDNLMLKRGWDFIGKETEDNIDTYKWKKKDYQCHLYIQNDKITNYNIF